MIMRLRREAEGWTLFQAADIFAAFFLEIQQRGATVLKKTLSYPKKRINV
jgi:hypothetical protein